MCRSITSDLSALLVSANSPDVNRKVQLDGWAEELRALAKMFDASATPGGLRVWSPRGETYYLHAPEFERLSDVRAVLERGKVLVGRLNGLGVLKFGAFRPVRAVAVAQADPAKHFSVGSINPPTEALLAYLDYSPNRPPAMNATVGPIVAALPPVEDWASVADRHAPDVDDALNLLALAVRSEDWRLLYVVYEIIEDYHNGQQTNVAKKLRGGSAEEVARFAKEIGRFKNTANSRRALGAKARHGRERTPQPTKPMTFREASDLVHGLLLAWLRSLASPPPAAKPARMKGDTQT